MRRHRQQAQAIGLAAVAMVAMVGFLAFVIDAGLFFMIQRELQNTADVAALAGAAYLEPQTETVCPSVCPPAVPLPGQDPLNPPTPSLHCTGTFGGLSGDPYNAALVACEYGFRNAITAGKLCLEPVRMDPPTFGTWPRSATPTPSSPTIVVHFHCVAGYSFGRIISGLTSRTIGASSEAVLGLRNSLAYSCPPPPWPPQSPCPTPYNVTDFVIDFQYGPTTPPGQMRATRLVND